MHLDWRYLIDAQDPIVMEVRLLDAAILDRDLAIECTGETEDDAALHLCADDVGVHCDATIDDAPNMRRLDRSLVVYGDLHDLCDEAAESSAQCDAAALTRRQLLAPSGLFGSHLQDAPGARV